MSYSMHLKYRPVNDEGPLHLAPGHSTTERSVDAVR